MNDSSDMFPVLSQDDELSIFARDAKGSAKRCAAFALAVSLANLANSVGGKFAVPVSLSLQAASFFGHIFHVVIVGAGEQVRRIAARAIVAFVAEEQIVNRAIDETPRYAMRQIPDVGEVSNSVSLNCGASPIPAFVTRSSIYFFPKAPLLSAGQCGYWICSIRHIFGMLSVSVRWALQCLAGAPIMVRVSS